MTGSSRETGVRPAPVSIRLSESERSALLAKAGGRPVSTYIKSVLFGANAASSHRSARRVTADGKLLGQVLAQLGKSGLSEGVSRLAYLAENGTLLCDQRTLERLQCACDDIRNMRVLLMRALGKESPGARP